MTNHGEVYSVLVLDQNSVVVQVEPKTEDL